ncbi:dephospho-CoA kinase [Alteromonas sp. ASW11-130]|uniref:dephospho-CoA kinase n=1 Tax=Alteromonas sp. ASW11-130 TaxID=3015775 RepID=UPI00224293B2|nr:dephospho-CoA kinase [Alteromonas sp. ASW11-130]MCW8091614.1 dephospho-CoA kinase [Alteromonas sp. ASW11-130]
MFFEDKFVVGLTGGIGSGKSSVSKEFENLAIDVIDADVIAREVVLPGTPALSQISSYFGNDVLNEDGSLNRAILRQRVFNNDVEKEWLNALLHPAIRQRMAIAIKDTTSPYCILAVPLLIENNLTSLVNRVLVVDCPETLQIQRASRRDGSNASLIKSIINSQVPRETRLSVADDIIVNDGSLAEIPRLVNELHIKYLQLAKN